MNRSSRMGRLGFAAITLLLCAQASADVLGLWDINAIRSDPLDVEILSQKTGSDPAFPCREFHLTYLSQTWRGQDIRIEAFVVVPLNPKGKMPAVLSLHGHGGAGSAGDAMGKAREFKGVGMSISGPGQGKSTGRRDATGHWIDAVEDVRNSFMYQYPYAAMRAVTHLLTIKGVDPERIGVIGGSMGAMCMLIVNGLDSRVAVAVPVSGCGSYEPEMRAGKTWFYSLIMDALKISADHPGVQAFLKNLDPINYAGTQHAPTYLVCGAQDEPFPITCLTRTFAKMPKHSRINLVYDFNHGGFSKPDKEFQMYNNRPQYVRRCFVTANWWLHHYLDAPKDGKARPKIPETPRLSMAVGEENNVAFKLDVSTTMPVKRVLLCWSMDGSYTFNKAVMHKASDSAYELSVVLHQAERDALCAFAEVEYVSGLFLTCVPHFGPKFEVKVHLTRFPKAVYQREKSTEQVIGEFEKAMKDTSKSVGERLSKQLELGTYCRSVGRADRALSLFSDILERSEGKKQDALIPRTLYQRAAIHNDRKGYKKATADLELAVKLFQECKNLERDEIPRALKLLGKTRHALRKK